MDLQNNFLSFFDLHLEQLHQEILAYSREENLWKVAPGISNSAGNLCVHLWGNLNHFIGHTLGDTGYVRNRPREFSIKDLPRTQLLQEIAETRQMLAKVLPTLQDMILRYPSEELSKQGDIHYILLKLLAHFDYHLGQINYHRRILDV